MNIIGRLKKLEIKDSTCEVVAHTIFETRDMTEGGPARSYSDDPIYCEDCGQEKSRTILQLVDNDYVKEDAPDITHATFNINTRPSSSN